MGRAATTAVAATVVGPTLLSRTVHAQGTVELVHWSTLAASDGEVWQRMVDAFNAAHATKGVRIRHEVVPEDQYHTKLLSAAAAGQAPDFGWGTAGKEALLIKSGVVLPLGGLIKQAGLDLTDFSEFSKHSSKYPKFSDELYMVPMDMMSLQPLINTSHAKAAGLDVNNPPADGESLIEWGKKLTQRSGEKITRSGILMTGAGLQPAVTWGIVAEQMGFRRAGEDLKHACVNPEAGKAAMQWVIDLFDKYHVSDRNITDRYKAFGVGAGSIFWTGPWALNGYQKQGLPFTSFLFPKIGKERRTYFEMGGLEIFRQKDPSRNKLAMEAIKWLSDNSFLWTTEGRGVSPRKSILSRPDYKTRGLPWALRQAFVQGMEFSTVGEVPVLAATDFTIYTNTDFLTRTLEGVWVGEKSADDAMGELRRKWQKDLDQG